MIRPLAPLTRTFNVLFAAFDNDPCVTGSPDIAIRGNVNFDLVARTATWTVLTSFFPAIEMYEVHGGALSPLFLDPPVVSSVGALIPPGVRPHRGAFRF
jgi:hypothetical protein